VTASVKGRVKVIAAEAAAREATQTSLRRPERAKQPKSLKMNALLRSVGVSGWLIPSVSGLCWRVSSVSRLCWRVSSVSGQCRAILYVSGQCRTILYVSGQCRAILYVSGKCRAILYVSGKCRAIPGCADVDVFRLRPACVGRGLGFAR
jgi:hypothetical protein